jgi:hypothetical protein
MTRGTGRSEAAPRGTRRNRADRRTVADTVRRRRPQGGYLQPRRAAGRPDRGHGAHGHGHDESDDVEPRLLGHLQVRVPQHGGLPEVDRDRRYHADQDRSRQPTGHPPEKPEQRALVEVDDADVVAGEPSGAEDGDVAPLLRDELDENVGDAERGHQRGEEHEHQRDHVLSPERLH